MLREALKLATLTAIIPAILVGCGGSSTTTSTTSTSSSDYSYDDSYYYDDSYNDSYYDDYYDDGGYIEEVNENYQASDWNGDITFPNATRFADIIKTKDQAIVATYELIINDYRMFESALRLPFYIFEFAPSPWAGDSYDPNATYTETWDFYTTTYYPNLTPVEDSYCGSITATLTEQYAGVYNGTFDNCFYSLKTIDSNGNIVYPTNGEFANATGSFHGEYAVDNYNNPTYFTFFTDNFSIDFPSKGVRIQFKNLQMSTSGSVDTATFNGTLSADEIIFTAYDHGYDTPSAVYRNFNMTFNAKELATYISPNTKFDVNATYEFMWLPYIQRFLKTQVKAFLMPYYDNNLLIDMTADNKLSAVYGTDNLENEYLKIDVDNKTIFYGDLDTYNNQLNTSINGELWDIK